MEGSGTLAFQNNIKYFEVLVIYLKNGKKKLEEHQVIRIIETEHILKHIKQRQQEERGHRALREVFINIVLPNVAKGACITYELP